MKNKKSSEEIRLSYVELLNEKRFITNLVWTIFLGSIITLLAGIIVNIPLIEKPTISNIFIGGLGISITGLLFWILFNYRQRENSVEDHIKALNGEYGFCTLKRLTENKAANWKDSIKSGKFITENRWPMGLIFLVIGFTYSIILIAGILAITKW